MGEAIATESKFAKEDPVAFDICIRVTDANDPSQSDWARLEFSQNYGKGNFYNRQQKDIAMDTLHKLGFDGDDLSVLLGDENPINGKHAAVMIKENSAKESGKAPFFNVQYFVTTSEPTKLEDSALKSKMAALFGKKGDAAPAAASAGASASTTAASAPTVAFSDYSPFITCSKCGKPNASKSTKVCKACA
jgi:hypothetical protein